MLIYLLWRSPIVKHIVYCLLPIHYPWLYYAKLVIFCKNLRISDTPRGLSNITIIGFNYFVFLDFNIKSSLKIIMPFHFPHSYDLLIQQITTNFMQIITSYLKPGFQILSLQNTLPRILVSESRYNSPATKIVINLIFQSRRKIDLKHPKHRFVK